MNKIDERDIIFSRMNLKQGSAQYEEYYGRHPEYKEFDDALRALPPLCSQGTPTFDALDSPLVDSSFAFLSDIKHLCEGERSSERATTEPDTMTKRIKGLASFYGAALCGVAALRDKYVYSHRGRNADVYGQEIRHALPYAIVFAVEMDKELIFSAPRATASIAVTKGYIDGAVIGMVLSYSIRALGYEARNHMDGNYLVAASLVAQDAGLGEIGRCGLLVTERYGPRVRLGVVTTDVPLIVDNRNDFSLTAFCEDCGLCTKTCPAKAISSASAKSHGYFEPINADECYRRWRHLGNDCGICLASCPLSDNAPAELTSGLRDPSTRQEILARHRNKYPIRPYQTKKPDWLE